VTNIETTVENFFSTTLTEAVSASGLTFAVDDNGSVLASPAYLVIDPDNDTQREVVLADGTWGGSSFVCSSTGDRGLPGSAGGSQAHDSGTPVVSVPLFQHIRDLNDRIDANSDHGGLTNLGDDDHAQYALADGTRGAFLQNTAGLTLTVAASAPGSPAVGDLWVDTA